MYSPFFSLLPLLPLLASANKLIEIGQVKIPNHDDVGPQYGLSIYGVNGPRAGLNFGAEPDSQFRLISTGSQGFGGDLGPCGAGRGDFQYNVNGDLIGCHFWTTPGFNTDSNDKLRWVFRPPFGSDAACFIPMVGEKGISCDEGNRAGIYLTCDDRLRCRDAWT